MKLGRLSIVDEWYAGFTSRHGESTPLAFFTPDGDDGKADKRKATVDQWRNKSIPPRTIKSTPLVGYKIDGVAERYSSFGSGMDKWRVTDPRGFQLEITSDNILFLMSEANIVDLEIDQPCIWVRKGNNSLALLPTSSKLYTDLVASTAAAKVAASIPKVKPKAILFSSLKPGDRFESSAIAGHTAMYIGSFSTIAGTVCSSHLCYDTEVKLPAVKSGRYHVVKDRSEYTIVSSMNITKVKPADVELSPSEIADHIRNAVQAIRQDYTTKHRGIIALSDTRKSLDIDIGTKSIPISWFTDHIDHTRKVANADIPNCQSAFIKIGSDWKYVPLIYRQLNDFIDYMIARRSTIRAGTSGGLLAALHAAVLSGDTIYMPARFNDIVGTPTFKPGDVIQIVESTMPGAGRHHRSSILDLLKAATDVIILDIDAKGIVQGVDIEYHSNP